MKQVYIRVDGNEIIATGHVMRCLSIAEQIRKTGAEVIFVTADDNPVSMIRERGFSVDVLGTIWNDLDKETEIICDYVVSHKVKVMLLDSYFVTREYLQKLSHYTGIVYIDDLNQFVYPVHTLINYGVFTEPKQYTDVYRSERMNTRFFIGGQYIPLREEFAMGKYEVRETVRKVLITTGGTDLYNITGALLQSVIKNSELKALEYHVIVGCFNQNREKLYELADESSNIHLHDNVKNMAEWMRSCDVAISAGGTTLYELCACGIPTICLEIADNQEGAIAWEENGYMLYAGNAYKNKDQCIRNSMDALLQYTKDYDERKRRSVKMQSLVDGYGARRIAEYVVGLL